MLNGSNARMYKLTFADQRRFHVTANDAGLLGASVEVEQFSLTPGERAEIIVAFAPGEQVVLRSVDNGVDIGEGDFDLLKFIAAKDLKPAPNVPARLASPPPITAPAGARVRRFRLSEHDAINGKEMDMAPIDEVVPAGAVEIWEIENNVYSRTSHIHEVAFQVLETDGSPPPAYATGYKDTVYVPATSLVRLAVQFGDFTDPASPYMYHCHILRHEDSGMMGQFVIVKPGTEAQVNLSSPAHTGH
ncbi:multicopper oxidase family protein [Nonomuraea ceibae]|uniref:multicopper oxidase family protein n=1 Tax=Nonomuraea ceibae TaxID=1935170 RepID=UPI001C5D6EBF|nr:multicopper oxidase domain-containing protein [Nonomuraea ceibae]